MKRLLIAVIMTLVMVTCVYADNITTNDWIKLENGLFGTTSGGEFKVFKSEDGTKDGVYTYQNFTTFCFGYKSGSGKWRFRW